MCRLFVAEAMRGHSSDWFVLSPPKIAERQWIAILLYRRDGGQAAAVAAPQGDIDGSYPLLFGGRFAYCRERVIVHHEFSLRC